MTCNSCGSSNVKSHPATSAGGKGILFEAQSYYNGAKTTSLPPASRCSNCGNQHFPKA